MIYLGLIRHSDRVEQLVLKLGVHNIKDGVDQARWRCGTTALVAGSAAPRWKVTRMRSSAPPFPDPGSSSPPVAGTNQVQTLNAIIQYSDIMVCNQNCFV